MADQYVYQAPTVREMNAARGMADRAQRTADECWRLRDAAAKGGIDHNEMQRAFAAAQMLLEEVARRWPRMVARELSDDQVRRAVDAYDAARCAHHGQPVERAGMSDQNKKSIAPLIRAAIEAALAEPL